MARTCLLLVALLLGICCALARAGAPNLGGRNELADVEDPPPKAKSKTAAVPTPASKGDEDAVEDATVAEADSEEGDSGDDSGSDSGDDADGDEKEPSTPSAPSKPASTPSKPAKSKDKGEGESSPGDDVAAVTEDESGDEDDVEEGTGDAEEYNPPAPTVVGRVAEDPDSTPANTAAPEVQLRTGPPSRGTTSIDKLNAAEDSSAQTRTPARADSTDDNAAGSVHGAWTAGTLGLLGAAVVHCAA